MVELIEVLICEVTILVLIVLLEGLTNVKPYNCTLEIWLSSGRQVLPVHAVTYRAHYSLFIKPSLLNSLNTSWNTLLASVVRLFPLSKISASTMNAVYLLVIYVVLKIINHTVTTSFLLIRKSLIIWPLSWNFTMTAPLTKLKASHGALIFIDISRRKSKTV